MPVDVADSKVEFNRRYAKWTALRMQLRYPEFEWRLYVLGFAHYLVASCGPSEVSVLAKEVDEMRPLSCHVSFADRPPTDAVPVDIGIALSDELWMSHQPLRLVDVQRALWLAGEQLPEGDLDFDPENGRWTFSSPDLLSDEEESRVRSGLRKLGQPGTLEFAQAQRRGPPIPPSMTEQMAAADLELRSSGELRSHSLKDLVEHDEAVWRELLNRRERRLLSTAGGEPVELACTWAAEDQSDVSLGELLTLYDRVDFIAPSLESRAGGILKQLGLKESEFLELVSLRKLRLILPRPVFQYEARVVQMAAEASPGSVVLSRTLAAAVIEHGQRKDPLLYGPFSSSERAALLAVLMKLSGANHPLRAVLTSYAKSFEDQNLFFMGRGAMACITHGVGPHMANILEARTGVNRRLELMMTGAQLEWSLGLGAAYVPPVLEGFSTDQFASFIASYYGRSGRVGGASIDPVANRIHTVVNSLLVPTAVPPLEVVKNLQTGSLQRFRTVARKLMTHTANKEELEAAVTQVNDDISAYERRLERLRKYGMGALAATAIHHAVAHELHGAIGFGGSVVAMWLGEMLYEHATKHSRVFETVASVADTLRGLILAPSLDAVIVRQVRNEVAR